MIARDLDRLKNFLPASASSVQLDTGRKSLSRSSQVRGKMGHPFANSDSKKFRERVAEFVQTGLHRTTATNILFICGGSEPSHLRPRFIEYMRAELKDYIPFKPEIAQDDYFANDQGGRLNLSDFEELISDLALGIVLFAESPGSYAELGLFSALENVRKKTLVILDANKQGPGSFLSMGPAATISRHSRFGDPLQMPFDNPNFGQVRDSIYTKLTIPGSYRSIGAKDYSKLTTLEVFSLIWFYVDFLQVASLDDIVFCMDSAFGAHTSNEQIRQVISVLVGANLLRRIEPLGLVRVVDNTPKLAESLKTKRRVLEDMNVEMLALIDACEDEYYLEAFANVA